MLVQYLCDISIFCCSSFSRSLFCSCLRGRAGTISWSCGSETKSFAGSCGVERRLNSALHSAPTACTTAEASVDLVRVLVLCSEAFIISVTEAEAREPAPNSGPQISSHRANTVGVRCTVNSDAMKMLTVAGLALLWSSSFNFCLASASFSFPFDPPLSCSLNN